MKQNIIIVMLTAIIFLLLRRDVRQHQTATVQVGVSVAQPLRKDRTLEELSPTYAESVKTGITLYDYPSHEVYPYVRKFVDEFMQPNLTPGEHEAVKDFMTSLFHYGRQYDSMRESKIEEQTNNWLSEVEGGEQ
jgi:hypothetical protein